MRPTHLGDQLGNVGRQGLWGTSSPRPGADAELAARINDLLLPIFKGVGSERAYQYLVAAFTIMETERGVFAALAVVGTLTLVRREPTRMDWPPWPSSRAGDTTAPRPPRTATQSADRRARRMPGMWPK
ncbi:hypothetical protein ABZV58_17720 [Nocardia sp. NPDC004654]|uniref:hypothetical protein n=1 Tax=Nocardia sp. NPDC004654 TaxID=3154776 RepID=UPI0033BE5047